MKYATLIFAAAVAVYSAIVFGNGVHQYLDVLHRALVPIAQ